VDAFAQAPDAQRRRAKIAASELFDNLVAHGRGLRPPLVLVSLRRGPRLRLTLRYRCANFDDFVRALDAVRGGKTDNAPPRYDAEGGIYRGFGLRMCRSVSSSIEVRRGLLAHRVSVVF
jgi:hypothetical protein